MRFLASSLSFVVLLAISSGTAWGQEDTSTEKTTVTTYESADWFTWEKMTGDWGGTRATLADQGFTLDFDITQILQTNMRGGADTSNGTQYTATADLELTLDFQKMGLWDGGSLLLHGELKTDDGVNSRVGSYSPVNLDVFKPGYEGCDFTLSEVIYTQVLFDGKIVLLGGKLDGSRAFDTNEFANNEHTQFMNTALRNNPMIPPFLPYTNWGIGLIVNPTPWLSILTAVADSEGGTKLPYFDTAFHGDLNATIIHEWAFKVAPFDKKGNYRVGFAWSSMDRQALQPLDTAGDNTMVYANFDQYLYNEADDPTQGVGIFGRFGWAREDANPINYYASAGVGGTGIIPERDKDTFGLGYYRLCLSSDMPAGTDDSEQGIECFYNIELAPWLHITPDVQYIIDPGGNDDSFVGGLRVHMSL